MNKKVLLGSIIGIVVVAIIVVIVAVFSVSTKSIDIKLDTNYKALIGVKVNSEVILVVNQKDKVSNIIYLNDESITSLANQKIEGKDIPTAIELVIDKLKNNNEFNNGEELIVTKYEDNGIYSSLIQELNKECVVYGIDNKMVETTGNIADKLNELNIVTGTNTKENIIKLDEYSKELLSK